jgi:carbonic anhydrase/acetyltransferase-like protein (isoleucine patch superfamily)
LELIFRLSEHFLDSLLIDEEEDEASASSSLKVFNQPIILRNLGIVNRILKIHKIKVPSKCSTVLRLIQDSFPRISVDEYDAENSSSISSISSNSTSNSNNDNDNIIPADTSTSARSFKISIKEEDMDHLELPLNSAVWYSQLEKNNISVTPIVYPWDFHYTVQRILQEELLETSISPNASISKSTIIDGPCIIEDDVSIDDFCKIKGPTFIGRETFIGMSSLIRNCMIGNNTRVGFNCEIGRSYLVGRDVIPHQNVIVDSLIGESVWFGAYSATDNTLPQKKRIMFEISKGNMIDTGRDHFGAVIGNNCTIGTSVIIFPGKHIQPGAAVGPETTVSRNVGE